MTEGIKKSRNHSGSGIAGAAYFMGFVAAAVYYIQNAVSFGAGVIGFLKALIWPAFLVYNVMGFINM
ncbi:MAG: hypothetical protein JW770_08045 [Actinobacteria bacterium]|nr:hypothetical protein [Actinomycetota bacterium]